jgi:hypothetical protein|nr:MAG TPA: hypothetical protein [Caudoviricetes sp.]
MIDKIELKIYTEIGIVTIVKQRINSVHTLSVSLDDRIEFIVKQLVNKSNDLPKATAIIYYDKEVDLSKFLYTNNIEDAYKIANKESGYENVKLVVLPYNIITNNMPHIDSHDLKELLMFLKFGTKERTDILNRMKSNYENTFKDMKKVKEFILNTIVGELTFETNAENFPNGVTVKLDNTPIILLEEIKDNVGENKLVLKRYPNKNVLNDDDYFNTFSYDINIATIAKETVDAILKDIEY